MIKEIKYEYNWCDYLTKCPHYKTIDVGSFQCHSCKFNEGFELEPPTEEQEKILNLIKIYHNGMSCLPMNIMMYFKIVQ